MTANQQANERAAHTTIMRSRDEPGRRVTQVELFFDLVFVFAVTQLSHLLLNHLTLSGGLHTLLLLLAVWWAWVYTAWITNWFDPNHLGIRLMLIGVMLTSMIMAAALPEAFGARGLTFAVAYATMQIGRSLVVVIALKTDSGLRRNFQRILAWSTMAGLLWLIGGIDGGSFRDAIWILAVLVDYAAPATGFVTPGMGRSLTADWDIDGSHLAERCQNFVIIAFGESILVTGASFGGLSFSWGALTAFVVAFLGSVALWWIYFDRAAEDSSKVIAESADPGRLGRTAYTYLHLPMVAGIVICAVGDELTIAHPEAPVSLANACVVLGGPALFLAGHTLFKRVVFGNFSAPRLVAIALLATLAPLSIVMSRLFLLFAVMITVAAVAIWDQLFPHPLPEQPLMSEAEIEPAVVAGEPIVEKGAK